MNKYFKYRDHNQVDCYFELGTKNNCLRAVFISDVFDDYKDLYYIEDEQYHMPELFMELELATMISIEKKEFDMQWGKIYTGNDEIKFLLKHTLVERK